MSQPTLKDDVGESSERGIPLPSEITAALNPSPTRRLLITLSFPIFFLLAVPIWWYTTSIVRLPLPTDRIAALENAPDVDIRTPIWLTADDDAFPVPPDGRKRFSTNEILSSIVEEVLKSADGLIGQKPPDQRGKRLWDLVVDPPRSGPPPLRAHIRRTPYANSSFPLQPYVQSPESGLITSGLPAGTLVVPIHPDLIGNRFLPIHYKMALSDGILALFPPHRVPPEIPLRALKYAPNITLSFVALNEDATDGNYVRGWDIENAITKDFLPHLEPLKMVFNFTIESQILYHAPLAFAPTLGSPPRDSSDLEAKAIAAAEAGGSEAIAVAEQVVAQGTDQAWLISEDDVKVFVNSEQWSLDSGSTSNPVLRFLLFIPSQKHRPMRLAIPGTAEAFLIPQYGSVALFDVPKSRQDQHLHLTTSALDAAFHIFTQHLYDLLALPNLSSVVRNPPPTSHLVPPNPFTQPLSAWQLEQIMRMRAHENSVEARKTLAGIVRIVSKIKGMQLREGVRNKVLGAVRRLEEMDTKISTAEAFVLSRDAVGLASQAFFDPSMMGLLYFPDEHKFAVYTPLFAPIAVPLILPTIRELLAWYRRRWKRGLTGVGTKEEGAAKPRAGVETNGDLVPKTLPPTTPLVGNDTDDTPVIRTRSLRSRSRRKEHDPE